MSKDANAKIFSIIGSGSRSGRWLVPAKTNMKTLFGRAIIDLRHAQSNAEEIEFTCLSVLANVTFIVPEGAEVRPSGVAIFGSSRSTVPLSDKECDLPAISVNATTIFGRLRIRTTDLDPAKEAKKAKKAKSRREKAAASAVTEPEAAAEPAPEPEPETAPVEATSEAPDASEADSPKTASPKDLSAPIEPFDPDGDTSPIEGVEAPDTIEGATTDTPAASHARPEPETKASTVDA